jgi:hypothetical protein
MIRIRVLGLALWGLMAGLPAARVQDAPAPVRPEGFVLMKTITVPGGPGWTDTGIDVVEGGKFWFEASGTISLQKGNPEADCGPEGLKLRTMQQPVLEQNLGCLVGKVRFKMDVTEDKLSGEKTIREYGETFFIGRAGPATMPVDGRLLLGPNENVAGDNDGAFVVSIYKQTSSRNARSDVPD